jgi:hypothetical protein
VGPGRVKRENTGSILKFRNERFLGTKNHQNLMAARYNHQEHIAETNTKKAVLYCSQKNKQYDSVLNHP